METGNYARLSPDCLLRVSTRSNSSLDSTSHLRHTPARIDLQIRGGSASSIPHRSSVRSQRWCTRRCKLWLAIPGWEGVVKGAFRKDLPDYPPVAVREAITNALMHRDYSPQARGSQVRVDLFVDRLEITNPGGLYGAVTIESLGKYGISSTRNQHLSALLEVTPSRVAGRGFVADNRGTGYTEIIDELARELLPPPTPRDSLTSFSLTFLRRAMTEPERAAATFGGNKELIIRYLREHYSATSRELAAAAGLSQNGVRKILNQLIEEGMVERMEALRSPKQRYRLVESIQ